MFSLRLALRPPVARRVPRVYRQSMLGYQQRCMKQHSSQEPEVINITGELKAEELDALFEEPTQQDVTEKDLKVEEEVEDEEEEMEECEENLGDLCDPNEDAKNEIEKELHKQTVYNNPVAKLQQHMVRNGIKPENAARYARYSIFDDPFSFCQLVGGQRVEHNGQS